MPIATGVSDHFDGKNQYSWFSIALKTATIHSFIHGNKTNESPSSSTNKSLLTTGNIVNVPTMSIEKLRSVRRIMNEFIQNDLNRGADLITEINGKQNTQIDHIAVQPQHGTYRKSHAVVLRPKKCAVIVERKKTERYT